MSCMCHVCGMYVRSAPDPPISHFTLVVLESERFKLVDGLLVHFILFFPLLSNLVPSQDHTVFPGLFVLCRFYLRPLFLGVVINVFLFKFGVVCVYLR